MEKVSQLSIEELLAGTKLLTFLQQLMAIRDEEIVDDLPPIADGDVVLGEMTPLEKRIKAWVDQRNVLQEQLTVALGYPNCCNSCTVRCDPTAFAAPCFDLYVFDHNTNEGFAFLQQLIEQRLPSDAETYMLRAGFTVVSVADKRESDPQPSGVPIKVITVGSSEEIGKILALMRSRGCTQ